MFLFFIGAFFFPFPPSFLRPRRSKSVPGRGKGSGGEGEASEWRHYQSSQWQAQGPKKSKNKVGIPSSWDESHNGLASRGGIGEGGGGGGGGGGDHFACWSFFVRCSRADGIQTVFLGRVFLELLGLVRWLCVGKRGGETFATLGRLFRLVAVALLGGGCEAEWLLSVFLVGILHP